MSETRINDSESSVIIMINDSEYIVLYHYYDLLLRHYQP